MELWTDLAVKTAAIRALAGELGLGKALFHLARAQVGPDPLAGLSPAMGADEHGTRAQLRPAVRVYRYLRRQVGDAEALRLTEVVVVAAGKAFLARRTAGLDPAGWRARAPSERRESLVAIGRGFPNATLEVGEVEETRFSFRVTACRFVELCRELGVPELTPVFCAADDAFFADGPVELSRPTLLSTGGAACAFDFTLRQSTDEDAGEGSGEG